MDPLRSKKMPKIKGYRHVRLMDSQGAMSLMYRGTRIKTGQEVIIKLMPAPKGAQEAPRFQHRFNQQIYIAQLSANDHLLAAIDHGNILMPGSHEPRLYLVYPYIEHGSLADLLTLEKPWETWELPHITDVIAQSAEGLFHLHKSGIVHQNVGPNSLLWRPTDPKSNPLRRIHVWLNDFGAAEPEQNGDVKYAVDQYALALVARLFLTGHEPPPLNDSASLLDTLPTQLNPQRLFEPEIDHVLFKALAPDPAARFTSVIEFTQALQGAVLKQIQRNPHADPMRGERSALSKTLIVLPPLIPPKPYEPPRPRDNAQLRTASRPKAADPLLPAVPAQKCLAVKLPDTLRMLAWSPDGTELACTFYHDHPQVISVNHSVETLPSFAHAHSVCWSPDDRFLAMSINDENNPQAEIRFCDRNAPKERHRVLSFDQPEPVRGFDWSQRGLFAIWLNHKLLVYDLSHIPTEKVLPEPAYMLSLGDTMFCDQLTTLRWSPDGEWLAAGSNNGQIVCWQPHTGRHFQQQPLKKNIRSISWSPLGRQLVIAFANKQVLFWNLQTEQVSQAWLPEHPRMVSISHQTGQVAVATEETLFFFERFGALAPTTRHPSQLYAAFSADNKLATLDHDDGTELIIWQI
jgi:protein kinase-like protein/WD40 domain-containing protein